MEGKYISVDICGNAQTKTITSLKPKEIFCCIAICIYMKIKRRRVYFTILGLFKNQYPVKSDIGILSLNTSYAILHYSLFKTV